MPLLTVLMLMLAAYAIVEGDVVAALHFLFDLDPHRISSQVALEALGLGFFSIGVGLGLMITYAAYSGANVSLKQIAVVSVLADTAISLLAGLAVFPIVFAYGLDPASGAGLVFVTLPLAFAQMPLGTLAAFGFFILLFVAALASAISMLELVVALLIRRLGMRRGAASAIAGSVCFLAGVPTVLSFNLWANWHPLESLARAREFHSVRGAGLPDLQHPAAGGRPRHLVVRGLGNSRSDASGRTESESCRWSNSENHPALHRSSRDSRGDDLSSVFVALTRPHIHPSESPTAQVRGQGP